MIEKTLFHSQQHTVLVPISYLVSSTVSLFSFFFFRSFSFFIYVIQPLEKNRPFFIWAFFCLHVHVQ